jgi:diguanylate cyclase (GGDEF)-like protein
MRLRTRTEVRSAERPRGYGDRTSPRAGPVRSRSGAAVAAILAGTALALGAIAVVLVHLLVSGHAATVATIAVGGAAVLAALILLVALWRLRRDHTRLARREVEALRLAELDDLTGLGNYRMFTRQLAAEVARARRHDEEFSLVLLDLDGFKAINDELGHPAGDDALRLVADALRDALREEDVCCRQGGDEFAVIAVRAGEDEAAELAERLAEAIEAIPFGGAGEHRLGASVGWATFGRPARSVDELVLRADAALRASKRGEEGAAPRSTPRAAVPQLRRGRLERAETARLALLAGLARALAGARDERTLAETTAAFLAGTFDAVGTAVVALDAHERVRFAAVGAGVCENGDDEAAVLAQLPVTARALGAAGPAVVEEQGRGETSIDGIPVRSAMAVAVLDEGRRWGWLGVASDHPNAFELAERALAEAIAEQLGCALSCRRQLDRLRDAGFGELYRVAVGSEAAAETESWRIAELAWQVGRALWLGDMKLRALYLAALFHDVGTVGVPAALLAHPGELRDEERAVLREHAQIGERILRTLPLLREAAPIVRHEHERFDGTGYPDGLAGEEIPLAARILHACDAFVSMTSPRPWRGPRSLDAAREELRRVAGTQLDPRVVDVLLEVLEMGSRSTPPPAPRRAAAAPAAPAPSTPSA